MVNDLALIILVCVAIYFFSFGLIAWLSPAKASSFLLGFASRAELHYLELLIRILVGAAFITRAPGMIATKLFLFVGWTLIATSAGLLLLPWRWHQRFAQRAVPQALRFLSPIAMISIALGAAILYCVFAPGAS